MSIRDLPVEPSFTDDRMSKAYIQERNEVQNEDSLQAFTKRWKALWTLNHGKGKITPEEESIINGTYDAKSALKCLIINRNKKECEHVGNDKSCIGMHLTIPVPLLSAFFASKHFGVPVDTALIQANGGMGEIDL